MLRALVVLALLGSAAAITKCRGWADYRVTMEQVWSRETTVRDYPNNAHFSPMAAASHVGDIYLAQRDTRATAGVVEMAETGGLSSLRAELDALKERGLVYQVKMATGGPVFGVAEQEIEVRVDEKFDFVSAVSMMAPSPDWFASVRMVLCDLNTGQWIARSRRVGNLFDAGSDSGRTFTAQDDETRPQGDIKDITETTGNRDYPFFNPSSPIPPQTYFRFELLDTNTKPVTAAPTTTEKTRRRRAATTTEKARRRAATTTEKARRRAATTTEKARRRRAQQTTTAKRSRTTAAPKERRRRRRRGDRRRRRTRRTRRTR